MINMVSNGRCRVREIAPEQIQEIKWKPKDLHLGSGQTGDKVVLRADEILSQRKVLVIEHPKDRWRKSSFSALSGAILITSRLANRGILVESTLVKGDQADKLKLSPDDKFIPRYILKVRDDQ